MDREYYRRIEQLYFQALEREETQRAGFLLESCAGDETLLREVASLLRFEKSAERFMEVPASELVTSALARDEVVAPTLREGDMEIREGDPEMIGWMIGQYRITRKVGEGGMGTVYAAHDERLDRSVALKMIQSSALKPEAARRLWREARTAAGINHPNICQVYEVGESNGNLFIAMELLDGE